MSYWVLVRKTDNVIQEWTKCATGSPDFNVYAKAELVGSAPDDPADAVGGTVNPSTKEYTPEA